MLPTSIPIRLLAAATVVLGLWHPVRYVMGSEAAESVERGSHQRDRDAQRQRELVFHERFDVAAGGTLRVDLPDADIEVRSGGGDDVEVEVFLRSRDMDWAMELFERMQFRAEAEGSTVRVTARSVRIRDYGYRHHHGLGMLVRITVPTRFNADIETADGDIYLEDLDGDFVLRSEDGDIEVGRIRGQEFMLETSDGDVRADALEVTRATLETSDGDIEVRSAQGDIRASTSDGDIRIGLGAVQGVQLRTSDGDITIYAPSGMAAEVDFEGEDLNVSRGFNITGRVTRRRVFGEMNGGGPRLEARTSDGTISLRQGR